MSNRKLSHVIRLVLATTMLCVLALTTRSASAQISGQAPGFRTDVRLAYDGSSRYLSVWMDVRSGTAQIFGAIVQKDGLSGTLVNGSDIQISNDPQTSLLPAVAFLPGTGFVVVWCVEFPTWRELHGAVVNSNGSILRRFVVESPAATPSLSFLSDAQAEIACTVNGTIPNALSGCVVLFSDSGGAGIDLVQFFTGNVGTAGPFVPVVSPSGGIITPSNLPHAGSPFKIVGTSDTHSFYMVFSVNNQIFGQELTFTVGPNVYGAITISLTEFTSNGTLEAVGTDGTNVVAVYDTPAPVPTSTMGQFAAIDGPIGTPPFAVSNVAPAGCFVSDRIAPYDGTNYLFSCYATQTPNGYTLYGTKFSATGAQVQAATPISSTLVFNSYASLFDGNQFYVAFDSQLNGSAQQPEIYGLGLGTDPPPPTLFSTNSVEVVRAPASTPLTTGVLALVLLGGGAAMVQRERRKRQRVWASGA
jgi:hypothetical protein